MNFLAHAYLSFGNKDILTGNMVSDFVKGKAHFNFPDQIYKGIRLHRMIDEFTDHHPVTLEAQKLFYKDYRLYGGPLMDIVYDYFLANDQNEFNKNTLFTFAQQTYLLLTENQHWFPETFTRAFHYMQQQNWLYGYSSVEGIFNAFAGLVRRARYLNDSKPAEKIFIRHYDVFNGYYQQFWGELKSFAKNKYNELL